MSQQHIHKKGKGRGGKKFIQNGGSSGLNQDQQRGGENFIQNSGLSGLNQDQQIGENPIQRVGSSGLNQNNKTPYPDLNKAGRGPMPYNSNNQPGKYVPTVYNNMKNFKNISEVDDNFWKKESFKKTLESFKFNYKNSLISAYCKLNREKACKVTIKDVKNFFQYIEWLIEYADDIADRSVDKLELYKTVDKLKLYRKHIKDMYYKQCKNFPDLKNVYLKEDSELGALDVFEPGVKVLKQKDDCAVELKPIGFTADEYKNFCASNASTQGKVDTKMNQYVSDLMDSEVNKAITWYNNNISNGTNNLLSVPQKKYDEKTINLFFMLFHNDILNYLNSSTSNNAQSYDSKNATLFLQLLEIQLNKSASSSEYFVKIMGDTNLDAKNNCSYFFPDDTSIKTIKNGLLGDTSLLTHLLRNAKTSFESKNKNKNKNYNNYKDLYKFLDTGYKNDQDKKDNFIEILSQKGKFLFLHDLLQTDDKNKLLPNNSLYDFSKFRLCDVKIFFGNILIQDKLKKHFDALKKPLFEKPPSASDIQQAQIGDCYFLATLISLLNDTRYGPNFIRKMMIDNQDGTVTVKLYKTSWLDCKPKSIVKEDYMDYTCHPVLVTVPKTGQIHNHKSALWVQILEKAYALVRGNQIFKKLKTIDQYELTHSAYNNNKSKKNISSIWSGCGGYYVFKTLTGCPLAKSISYKYKNDDIVSKFSSEVTPNKNVACTVDFKKSSQIEPYVLDIFNVKHILKTNHTYSIRCDSTPSKYILINPHDGSKEITFQLSDNSNFKSFINRISYIPLDSLEDSIFMSLRMLF